MCRGEINLIDPEGKLTANVGWDQSYKGMVIQRGVDGQYKVLNERSNLMKKLETLGNFKYFLQALNVSLTFGFHTLYKTNVRGSPHTAELVSKAI